MIKVLAKQLRTTLTLLGLFTLLTGALYPLFVTAIAQIAFPFQANGSLVERNGVIYGSELIGQPFDDPSYFWGRPSLTQPYPYNGGASAGSNLSPSNPELTARIAARIEALKAADPANPLPIPVDLITDSGSGLDPHISPATAEYQVERIARLRGLDPSLVHQLVENSVEGRTFGLFGEPRVNVFYLNLALDNLQSIS
ncbi:MAG: potassium-transporting ATPase subunit KdpC [Candidatus Promineifilaceae bacterium]